VRLGRVWAELLVALPGDGHFIVRVPGREPGGEAGLLLLGEMLGASPHRARPGASFS
jgi:hypothetical protein